MQFTQATARMWQKVNFCLQLWGAHAGEIYIDRIDQQDVT